MKSLLVFTTLLVGLCSAQIEKTLVSAITDRIVDPISIDPCSPKPTPSHPFLDWDGSFLDSEWWEYVQKPRKFPKSLSKKAKDATCKRFWESEKDKRHFYWQISCPYDVFWLSKFTRRIANSPGLTETCFVLFPCWEQVRIVNCTTPFCTNRCREKIPNVRNSVCLENALREFRGVWVFCTQTHRKKRTDWQRVDCKRTPQFCLKKVNLLTPQCCECWSCWDMRVTMSDVKVRGKK